MEEQCVKGLLIQGLKDSGKDPGLCSHWRGKPLRERVPRSSLCLQDCSYCCLHRSRESLWKITIAWARIYWNQRHRDKLIGRFWTCFAIRLVDGLIRHWGKKEGLKMTPRCLAWELRWWCSFPRWKNLENQGRGRGIDSGGKSRAHFEHTWECYRRRCHPRDYILKLNPKSWARP